MLVVLHIVKNIANIYIYNYCWRRFYDCFHVGIEQRSAYLCGNGIVEGRRCISL